MKRFLLFILLLSACFCFAQNLEKDTIQLKEIFVGSIPPKKSKTVKKRFSGICSYFGYVRYGFEKVSLVADMPEGYISSVTFNFNHKVSAKSASSDFKDVGLELVFYEVTPAGSPGALIGQPLLFTLKGSHTGKLEIPVPYPMVKNPGSFFVGLRRVSPGALDDKADMEVHCQCSGDGYISYQYNSKLKNWVRLDYASATYKMTIKEIVLPAKKKQE